MLCPVLGKDDARLNGLAKSDLICQYRTIRQWRFECKECCINLMWCQVHLRIVERCSQLVQIVGRQSPFQEMGKVFGVIWCDTCHLYQYFCDLHVVGRGDLDVLTVALDECDVVPVAFHDGGIVGEAVVVWLLVGGL